MLGRMSAHEAVEGLRAALAALVVDPAVRLERSFLGAPAAEAELAPWRGRVPDDLLDVLAVVDGVEIVWAAQDVDAPGGMLRLAPAHALAIVRGGYVLVDGRTRGMGSYYRLGLAPDVVYTLRGDEARQAEVVCDGFVEYLALAAEHRFAASWTDDVAYRRQRALRERDREAAARAVDALGADTWRAWRDALWGSPADVAAIAPQYTPTMLPALLDAGESIAAGLAHLALLRPDLTAPLITDPRPRLRLGVLLAWASTGRSPLTPTQLATLRADPDLRIRRAAAAVCGS